jgi:hypothetical protein
VQQNTIVTDVGEVDRAQSLISRKLIDSERHYGITAGKQLLDSALLRRSHHVEQRAE